MSKKLFWMVALLGAMMVALAGCDNSETTNQGGGEVEGNMPNITRLTPKGVDIAGSQGFVVFDNNSTTKTRADLNGDGIDDNEVTVDQEEATPQAPYALYTIDDKGDIRLSVFYFEVQTDEEGGSVEMQNQLCNALQIVPRLMTDLGKYLLFSCCSIQLTNPSALSPEVLEWWNMMTQERMPELVEILGCPPHMFEFGTLAYMVRKADGALFDISTQGLFSYFHHAVFPDGSEVISPSDGSMYDKAPNYIDPNSYRISEQGDLFVLARSGCIVKVSDNGDAIDVSTMTQPIVGVGAWDIDKDGNIYAVSGSNGNETTPIYVYKAAGGFDLQGWGGNAYDFISMCKNDNTGDIYVFTTAESEASARGLKVGTLKDGVYTQTYLNEDVNNEFQTQLLKTSLNSSGKDAWAVYLGCQDGVFKWYYGSFQNYVLLAYDSTLNTAQKLSLSAEIDAAMKENYDATMFGNFNYGVKLGQSTIEVTNMDIASGKVIRNTFEVNGLQNIVGKTCFISRATPTLYVSGLSTADGTNVHISVDLLTGDNLTNYGTDARKVVSLLRLN